MVRTPSDDPGIADPVSPLLWENSRYLVSDDSHARLLQLLDAFNALSSDQIEDYPKLNRAILQHHLWTVFDWTTTPALLTGDMLVAPSKLRKMQGALAVAIRKLALSDAEIQSLPNPLTVTAATEKFPQNFNAEKTKQPFLPRNLLKNEGPWVCLSKVDHAVPAIVHTNRTAARSAFHVFMRLPDGREATLKYIDELSALRNPWVSGKQPPYTQIPPHPTLIDLNLHDNPMTPQFPVGTQLALVKQALLINDMGQPTFSPIVQRIQLRVYLNVDVDSRRNNPSLGPSQVFSEFVMQPREMMQGNVPMRPIAAEEIHHTTIFTSSDPIEYPRSNNEPVAPRLRTCITCHSGAGIHSVNSRFELFQKRSLKPPSFAPTVPETIGAATTQIKSSTYSWGFLKGLWAE